MNVMELKPGAGGILRGYGSWGMLGGSPGEELGQPEHGGSHSKGIVGRDP